MDYEELPLHTNKYHAMKQASKKRPGTSERVKAAVASGDIKKIFDVLTPKQRAFCEEFLVDLVASHAAKRAGYSASTDGGFSQIGAQLLENQAVRIAIDSLRAERTKNSAVTKDFVLTGIMKAIQMAEEAKNLNALLRGHELLARHLGMFIERTEISGKDGEAIKLQKTEEDVNDFLSSISHLSKRNSVKEIK